MKHILGPLVVLALCVGSTGLAVAEAGEKREKVLSQLDFEESDVKIKKDIEVTQDSTREKDARVERKRAIFDEDKFQLEDEVTEDLDSEQEEFDEDF